MRELEGLMVSNNEKAVSGDYDILKVAFSSIILVAFLEGRVPWLRCECFLRR